jgi:hypothetical protein
MVNNLVLIGIFSTTIISILLIHNILSKFVSLKKDNFVITEFATYMSILKYFEEVAFDIIYRKEILTYSMSGWAPDDKVYAQATKNFVRLVLKLLGKRLVKELENLYGGSDTLIEGISLYFYSRIESDEIRKIAVNDLLSDQEETPNQQVENSQEKQSEEV